MLITNIDYHGTTFAIEYVYTCAYTQLLIWESPLLLLKMTPLIGGALLAIIFYQNSVA